MSEEIVFDDDQSLRCSCGTLNPAENRECDNCQKKNEADDERAFSFLTDI